MKAMRIVLACVVAGLVLTGCAKSASAPSEPSESAPPVAAAAPYVVPAGRSPIPQPGEQIVHPIAAPRLAPDEARAAAAPPPDAIVPWDQAAQHIGQTITVEGKVLETHDTGSVCFLNFVKPHDDRFYIIIFSDALGGWGERAETLFLNQTIRVTGKVDTHNQVPQIRVRDPKQIVIVDTMPG